MPVTDNKQEIERKLEQKYANVISHAKQLGAKIENSHIENNKLVLRIAVPNDQVKSQIWDQAKTIDRDVSDLSLQVHVDSSLETPKTGGQGQKSYTVQSGDTLSEIAQRFYGNAGQYMKIFNANRDILSDPDKIQVGQTLKIPE